MGTGKVRQSNREDKGLPKQEKADGSAWNWKGMLITYKHLCIKAIGKIK